MDGHLPAAVLLLILLTLMNIMLYGFGAALQNLNQTELEEKAEEGDEKAKRLLQVLDKPGRFITTLHIVTTVLNMAAGAGVLFLVREMHLRFLFAMTGEEAGSAVIWWWVQTVVCLLVLFILLLSISVVIPRKMAQDNPELWADRFLMPVSALMKAGLPLAVPVTAISGGVLRLFGVDPDSDEEKVTEDDIKLLVSEGHEKGIIKAGEAEMVQNVFELDEKEAGDIMTHRTNIVALDGEMTLSEAVNFIRNEASNSRFPVYQEDIDHIIGILHIRDVLNYSEEPACREKKISEIEGLLRKPNFIPEIRKIDQLFHEMQARKSHMEIVVDEYGQTAGIVTLEDILEEIVGNIQDEYDEEEKLMVRRSDGTWLLDGMAPLSEVDEKLNLHLGEKDLENFETVSGFLISRLDRIPEEGEKPVVACCGWIFKIRQVGGKTIRTIVAAPGRRTVKQEEE